MTEERRKLVEIREALQGLVKGKASNVFSVSVETAWNEGDYHQIFYEKQMKATQLWANAEESLRAYDAAHSEEVEG